MTHFSLTTRNGNQKRPIRTLLVGVLLLLLVFTLGACDAWEGGSTVEIGMVENSGFNNTEARFETLRGRKVRQETLSTGETLVLDYDVTVDKGTLTLMVEDPSGESVWETEVTDSAADQVEIVAAEAGNYDIIVEGDDAGGSYDLSWTLES